MSIRTKPIPKLSAKELQRLHSKIDMSGGEQACWNWLGGVSPQGYGIFYRSRLDAHKAHRLMLALGCEPPEQESLACHRCDNTSCCNPNHLYWGTQLDNMRDMCVRGRQGKAKGSRHASAKLTETDVLKIKQLSLETPQIKIAEEFGVTPSTVSKIVKGLSWRHLTQTR